MRNRKPTKKPSQNKISWLDIWLARISHISQAGLLLVTIFIYVYTVVPVYDKNKLDKEITKKEHELAETNKQLEHNYSLLRKDLIGGYVFYVGAECTGLLRKAELPIKLGEKPRNPLTRMSETFEINISECLNKHFKEAKSLKNLRPRDYSFLHNKIIEKSQKLDGLRKSLAQEFVNYPSAVQANPNLLPPLDNDSFTARTLEYNKALSLGNYEKHLYQARLIQGLEAIVASYRNSVQTELKSLLELNWPQTDTKPISALIK